ncbi:MAG: septation protein A [Beijerinckiaceae bacterium]
MTETGEPAAEAAQTKTAKPPAWIKPVLEFGPLVLFFFANARPKLFHPFVSLFLPANLLAGENAGLFTATSVLMPAAIAALVVSYVMTKRVPVMPLVTAILVVVFGALTLYLQDPSFIKMKPTILYVAFGTVLFGGLVLKKPLLPIVFDNALSLSERGWFVLTLRWAIFFFTLAVLNEIVWRTQSNDVWVAFKFPGTVIIIFLFTLTQVPLMLRHEVKEAAKME